jgi:hypothetical protein
MGTKIKSSINWQEHKAQILASLDLRQEFETLGLDVTGREPGPDGWLECRAIDRDDNTPSAAVNVTSGWYKDLGGAGQSLSFWDLAVSLKRFPNWKTARDHYAAKAGLTLNGNTPRDPAEHLAFMPWNDNSANLITLWCRHKPGVTPEAVQAAGGRLARYCDQYTVVTLPIYGPALVQAEPVGWVLWNTTGRDLPIFRGKDRATGESKISWKKMKTTGGSEAGLIGRHSLERINAGDPAGQIVWKVEGPTDLLALWSIIPPDKRDRHLVVTNAGGSNQHPLSWMAQVFAGRRVAVIHDADEPGQAGAQRWATWAAKVAVEVRLVRLPYEIAKDHGRDLRDWITEDVNEVVA